MCRFCYFVAFPLCFSGILCVMLSVNDSEDSLTWALVCSCIVFTFDLVNRKRPTVRKLCVYSNADYARATSAHASIL